MRVLLGLFALLCSVHCQDSCPFQLKVTTDPWLCRRSGYSCAVQSEVTLRCRVQVDERSSAHNIRWFSSNTSDWEASGTLHNGTLTNYRSNDKQTVISSNITVPLSAGYWRCEVTENEEILFCSEMPIVHIFRCFCAAELAECPSSRDECDWMGPRARCSPSTSDSFCLMYTVVDQTPPGSPDSISETNPTIRVAASITAYRSHTRNSESLPETTIRMATTMPTFQSPGSSESMSETKTVTTKMLNFQTTYISTTYAKSTPHTTPEGGDDAATLKLLPVVVAPVAGVIMAVFAVVLGVIIAAAYLFRVKGVKQYNDSTDTDGHIYDTVDTNTVSSVTTDDRHYSLTPFSLVSTESAADYEEPLSALKAAGNKRLQMDLVNPVYLEMYGSPENTSNDQEINDS